MREIVSSDYSIWIGENSLSKLNVKSYDSYINNFNTLFPDYFCENKVGILEIVLDKKFLENKEK